MNDHFLRDRVFSFAIACEKDEHGFWPRQEEVVATKSPALRAVYYATELHMLVFNGGLYYYFDVHGLLTVRETIAALRFINAGEHLRVFERALENILRLNGLDSSAIESSEYVSLSPMDEHIADEFAKIEPELGTVVSQFIRAHPDLYQDALKDILPSPLPGPS